jgi:hypothetical protein
VKLGNLTIHVEKLEALFITGNSTLVLTAKFFPWRSGSYSLVERTSNMDRTTSERNEEENGSNFGMIQEGEQRLGCLLQDAFMMYFAVQPIFHTGPPTTLLFH